MAANRSSPKARGVSRNGSARRRKLEFMVVRDQILRRKEQFIRRLEARVVHEVSGCKRYRATCSDGYPLITFRYKGKLVVMKVHRVFAIIRHCAPIPLGMDVGHLPTCKNRDCVVHTALQPADDNSRASIHARHKGQFA